MCHQQPDDGPLNHAERTDRFQADLSRLIEYYIEEYDLTLAEFVGVMQTELFNRQISAWHDAQDDDANDS